MKLKNPVFITSRMLPGIQIGNAIVQLEYDGTDDGRTVYRYTIDLKDEEGETTFSGNDLKSGRGGGSLNEGFSSLLVFLAAFAEGSPNLFPEGLKEWASQHINEIVMAEMEFDENILIEE